MKDFWIKWRREIVRGAFLFTTVVVVGLLVISGVNRGIKAIPGRLGLDFRGRGSFNPDFDTDAPSRGPGRRVAAPWTYRARVAPDQWVWVHNVAGPIKVEPGRGDSVEVVAVKSYRNSNPSSVRLVARPYAGGVAVCAIWGAADAACGPGGELKMRGTHNNDVGVEFVVRLPPGVRFGGTTISGPIDVTASAPVVAHTVSGEIDVRTDKGPVDAVAVNGAVRALMRAFGDSGDVNVVTVNGSVTVALPARLDANLDLSTVNGDIQSDYPVNVTGKFVGRHVRQALGAGGRRIHVTVVNGGIRLEKAGADSTGTSPPRPGRSARRSVS